ncbi:hypothetical protein E2C01_045141 [Portunus trituberculatus]|uniref:Uncharacterized protein n=1 Tax=Portunus trituberculatus TaxID=210409 RepID=A0A5B7G0G1_PORTR|nr:hypothetical protein [Portunus trituberculatus]
MRHLPLNKDQEAQGTVAYLSFRSSEFFFLNVSTSRCISSACCSWMRESWAVKSETEPRNNGRSTGVKGRVMSDGEHVQYQQEPCIFPSPSA